MKIRSGFVSNSSSSSFLIYGTVINKYDIENYVPKEFLQKMMEFYTDEYKNEAWFKPYKNIDDFINRTIIVELLEKYFTNNIEIIRGPYYDDNIYIGKSLTQIKDNQTFKEFKTEIEKQLKDKFGENIKCNIHKECWMDT